jgi:hypothetical protein
MAQALRGVAGPLGVCRQAPHLLRSSRADDFELDRDLLEVGRRVVDIVFLSVAKCGSDICGRVFDWNLIQRREPRQLRQQSKSGSDHHELERRGPLFGASARQRLVGLDHELAHAAFEMDVLDDARHRASGGGALLRSLRSHFGAKTLDLSHLLVQIHAFTHGYPSWILSLSMGCRMAAR